MNLKRAIVIITAVLVAPKIASEAKKFVVDARLDLDSYLFLTLGNRAEKAMSRLSYDDKEHVLAKPIQPSLGGSRIDRGWNC